MTRRATQGPAGVLVQYAEEFKEAHAVSVDDCGAAVDKPMRNPG